MGHSSGSFWPAVWKAHGKFQWPPPVHCPQLDVLFPLVLILVTILMALLMVRLMVLPVVILVVIPMFLIDGEEQEEKFDSQAVGGASIQLPPLFLES